MAMKETRKLPGLVIYSHRWTKRTLYIHRLGVKWDKVIKSRYVNGIPFVSNGYTKGVSFLSKDYIKWYSGVGPPGGASPYKINFTHSPLFNTRLINK